MARRREQARAALAKTAQGTPTMQFQTGDQVWLEAKHLALPYQAPKLAPKRHGPFTITKQVSPVAYKLDLPMGWTIHDVFHASLLTPYRETTTHGPNYTRPPPDLIAGEKEYEVENIVNHCFYGRQRALQYLVHWRGYPDVDNSWEPADQVHAPMLMARYHQRNPLGEAQTYKNPSKRQKVSICFTLLPTQQCPLPPSTAPSSPCPKHANCSSPTPTSPWKPTRPLKRYKSRTLSSWTKSWTKSLTLHSPRYLPAHLTLSLSWRKTTSPPSSQPPAKPSPLPRTSPSTPEKMSHSRHIPPSQPSHSPVSPRPRQSRSPSPLPTPSKRTGRTSTTRLSCMPRQSTASKTRFTPLQVPQRSPRTVMSRMTTSPPTLPLLTSRDDSTGTWPPMCAPAPDNPPTSSEPSVNRTTVKSTCAPSTLPPDTQMEGPSLPCPLGSSNSSAPSPLTPTPSFRPPTPNPTEDWPPTSTTTARLGRSSGTSTERRTALPPPSRPSTRSRGMSATTSNAPRPPLASTTSTRLSMTTPTPPSSSVSATMTTAGAAPFPSTIASTSLAEVGSHSEQRVMLLPAAALSQWEVKGQRKQRVNQPQVSYWFCQELNLALRHDNGPCDCMS
jgi:hypothetical protein